MISFNEGYFLFTLVKNLLTALITGRGFSKCTAWPHSGTITISHKSPWPLTSPAQELLISLHISSAILLNLRSFSPTISRTGFLQCFSPSQSGLALEWYWEIRKYINDVHSVLWVPSNEGKKKLKICSKEYVQFSSSNSWNFSEFSFKWLLLRYYILR